MLETDFKRKRLTSATLFDAGIGEMILASPPIGEKGDSFLSDTTKYTKVHKSGRARWKDRDGNLYEWDSRHQHVEKYTSRGRHIEVLDKNGNHEGEAVKGRKISTR